MTKKSKLQKPKKRSEHLGANQIMAIYERKTVPDKLKIMERASRVSGTREHRIAVAMGYDYSGIYSECTWIKK